MDGRPTWTDCDEAGDYAVPNVLSPRDLVFRPDNMDETVPHTYRNKYCLHAHKVKLSPRQTLITRLTENHKNYRIGTVSIRLQFIPKHLHVTNNCSLSGHYSSSDIPGIFPSRQN